MYPWDHPASSWPSLWYHSPPTSGVSCSLGLNCMHLQTVYALVYKPTEDANVTQEVRSCGATLCSSSVSVKCSMPLVSHRIMSQITLPLQLLALFDFTCPNHPSSINHSLYDFVSSVLIAWGLIGPVLTGLVVMAGAGGGFSSTFSWQVPGGSLGASGLLVSLSTLWVLLPICLLCCCSEKNRCVDWRTSALCFANT